MRSAVFNGSGDVRIEDVPEPQVHDNSILIDVEWCGLCGSDLHLYRLGSYVTYLNGRLSH